MMKKYDIAGQSLIEILFALSFFVVGVAVIGYLVIDAQRSLQKNIEYAQAHLLAYEGIEAVVSIKDRDFEALEEGDFSLILENGYWELQDVSEQAEEVFTRIVRITNVDEYSKKVESKVTFESGYTSVQDVTFALVLTDWNSQRGEASYVSIDTQNTVLSDTQESVQNIQLINSSETPVTVTEMVLQWNNFYSIQSMTVDGSQVFFATSSMPTIDSGVPIDVIDFVIEGGATKVIDEITFNGSMFGSSVLLSLTLGDGSSQQTVIDF